MGRVPLIKHRFKALLWCIEWGDSLNPGYSFYEIAHAITTEATEDVKVKIDGTAWAETKCSKEKSGNKAEWKC